MDGQENPLAVFETAKLYEVQKYCAMTNHVWDGLWLLANPRAWRALAPDLREIVARRFDDAGLRQRKDVEQLNGQLRTAIEAQGIVFTDPDPAPFRETLREAGFYADWRRRFGDGSWQLLERYVGNLA